MAFYKNFPPAECIFLGGALPEAVKAHGSDIPQLHQISADLGVIAATIAKKRPPEVDTLENADFARDQLIMSLYYSLKAWTCRVDMPKERAQAQSAVHLFFVDGYHWIDAPMVEQTSRLDNLLTTMWENRTLLEDLGLMPIHGALQNAHRDFLVVENECDLRGDSGRSLVVSNKILMNSFHRKLELYCAVVRESFSEPADRPRLTALFEPLKSASLRIQQQQVSPF